MNTDDSEPCLDTIRETLREVYAALAAEIEQAGPVCVASGRCCRFREYEHTLFLSDVEARLLLADAPTASRPLDDGATCPWQDALGRCTAREARPLGCRVYYCDPEYQERGEKLSERFIGRLKQICDEEGWPWYYAPLHHHLRRFDFEQAHGTNAHVESLMSEGENDSHA